MLTRPHSVLQHQTALRTECGTWRLQGKQADPRDKLKVMLQARAAAGAAVSREDIEAFFADLRQSRA